MFPTKRSVAPGLVLPEDGAVESVSQVLAVMMLH